MRKTTRTLALVACLTFSAGMFVLPIMPAFAEEQVYLTGEPTITVDAGNSKATVHLSLQDTEKGIKGYSYSLSWNEPNPDDPDVLLANGTFGMGERMCAAGTSLSCLEQLQKPMDVSVIKDDMIESVVYTLSGLSLTAEDGTTTNVSGLIKFSLDGIVSNTFAFASSEPETPAEDTPSYTVEEPIVTIDTANKTATVKITFQDATNGVNESYKYYVVDEEDNPVPQYDENGNPIIFYTGPTENGFSCRMGTTVDCRLQPISFTVNFSNLEEDHTYGVRGLSYKNNQNETINIPGQVLFRLNEGVIEQTFFKAAEEPSNPSDPENPTDPTTGDDGAYLTEEPKVISGENGSAEGVSFTVQDEENGVQTVEYILVSTTTDPDTGEETVARTPVTKTRTCETTSPVSCEEQFAAPFTIEVPFEGLNENTKYTITNITLVSPSDETTGLNGEIVFNTEDGIEKNTLAVMGDSGDASEPEIRPTGGGITNPKTADNLKTIICMFIGATGFIATGMKLFSRR